MQAQLADKIVEDFEQGRLTRRQLVTRLMGLGAAVAAQDSNALAPQSRKPQSRPPPSRHSARRASITSHSTSPTSPVHVIFTPSISACV